ncbi:MFS transporter [uncultured Williamsia sp.]|uniref:MFS transporter n=1 Tax=uncultured Williamsia sp. TaxID=259311 RepID=UPI0026378147|nr:MFS transporter [uncultured Williamsia sp.]
MSFRFSSSLVLAAVLGCQLMVVVDSTIVNVALPDIQRALGFSSASLSWVLNAYTLTFGGLLLLGARLGDVLGRRRTFLAGVALFAVASAAGGLATDAAVLLAARAVQGVGAAIAAPAALALLMIRFPQPADRARALGLFTAVSLGGFSIGLVAGGMLVEWLNWRWVMVVNVPIGVLVLVAGAIALPTTPRERRPFDLAGAVLSTGGVGALVFGLVRAAEAGWSAPSTLAPIAVGVAALGGFVLAERRALQPITPLRIFADLGRSSAFAGRLFMVAGFVGMMFFLTRFMQGVLGFGPLTTGLAYLPMTMGTLVATQFSARWASTRIGPRPLLVLGFALAAGGTGWLTTIGPTSVYGDFVGATVLVGFGGGLAFFSLTTAALRDVHPEDAGAASGMVNAVQQLGGALGLAVLVSVFGAATHATGGSAADVFTGGVRATFWVSTGLLLAGMALMALTQPSRVVRTLAPAPPVVEEELSAV